MHIALSVILFVFGASIGSFLNVVAGRFGTKRSFTTGRSHCPYCDHALRWFELIPILSWILQRARCRACKKVLSPQYIIVEVVTGLLLLGVLAFSDSILKSLLYVTVVSFFIVLFLVDLRLYVIPDEISIPAIILVGVLNSISAGTPIPFILGAVGGAFWFWLQFAVSKGVWVGGGDIRLGALMGALLGYGYVWLGLMVSYVGGSIVALALILFGKKHMKSQLPFATILLPGAFVTWMFGQELWMWYSGLIGF